MGMINVEGRLRAQHLAQMTGVRTDQLRHRMVEFERGRKILVGPSRLLHSRKRKRRETNKKGERTNGTVRSKVEVNHRVENAAVPKKTRIRKVVMQ